MALRLASRQWFWGLLCTAGIWCAAGYHWDAKPDDPRWMRKTQDNVIAPLPRSLLVAGEFVFSGIEGIAISAVERVTRQPQDAQSVPELLERIDNLQAEEQRLQALLAAADRRLGIRETLGDLSEKVVQANVLNRGSTRVHLDKGSSSGVAMYMPVIAPLDRVTVLGRVVAVGQVDCEALLFTDPNMSVKAILMRGDIRVTNEWHLITGFGGNEMKCEELNVDRPGNPPEPQRGDFVLLDDPDYPQQLQGTPIGRIEEVHRREDQPKRYDIHIAPLRATDLLQTVMIVTKP